MGIVYIKKSLSPARNIPLTQASSYASTMISLALKSLLHAKKAHDHKSCAKSFLYFSKSSRLFHLSIASSRLMPAAIASFRLAFTA